MEQNVKPQHFESIVECEDGRMFTTSLIVAEVFEKEHKNVLRDIENMECSPEFHQLNFEPMVYTAEIGSGAKRDFPAYRLTRDGFSFLAMGFTGKKAAAWKEKFLEAFNAMETALRERQAVPVEQTQTKAIQERRWTFFSPREKMSTANVQAIEGLIQMEAFIQGESAESITQHLCQEMNVRRLQDIQAKYFRQVVTRSLERLFAVRKWQTYEQETGDSLESMKKAFQGLSLFWMRLSGYTEEDVRNYVLNRCDADSLDEFATEKEMLKALFVLWGGVANHSLETGW